MPIVLCDLQGRTYEEAAQHLRCPVGTVRSRLARGRERLRHGLTRRGLRASGRIRECGTRPEHILGRDPGGMGRIHRPVCQVHPGRRGATAGEVPASVLAITEEC